MARSDSTATCKLTKAYPQVKNASFASDNAPAMAMAATREPAAGNGKIRDGKKDNQPSHTDDRMRYGRKGHQSGPDDSRMRNGSKDHQSSPNNVMMGNGTKDHPSSLNDAIKRNGKKDNQSSPHDGKIGDAKKFNQPSPNDDDKKALPAPDPAPAVGIPDNHLIFYPSTNWTVKINFEGSTCVIFRQWIEFASPIFKELLKHRPKEKDIDIDFEQDLKAEMLTSKRGRGYGRQVLPIFLHFCHILVNNKDNMDLATFLPALPVRGQSGFLTQSLQLCRLAEDLGCIPLQKLLTTLILGTIDDSADGIIFGSYTDKQVEDNTKRAGSLIQALSIIRAGPICTPISEWEENVIRVLSNVIFHAYDHDHNDGRWGLWWERFGEKLPNSILCHLMKGALRGIAEHKRDTMLKKVKEDIGAKKGTKRQAPLDVIARASGPLKRVKKEVTADGSAFAPLTIDD